MNCLILCIQEFINVFGDFLHFLCFLKGHKFTRKVYNGYECERCYKHSDVSNRTYQLNIHIFSIILSLAVVGFIFLYLGFQKQEFMDVPCCDSMFPVLRNTIVGDAVFNNKTYPCVVIMQYDNNYSIGDIVNYRYEHDEDILHRINSTCVIETYKTIYKIGNTTITEYTPEDGFILKGDHNSVSDGCIPLWAIRSKYVGKVFCIVDFLPKSI